jgi:hypothetical protein
MGYRVHAADRVVGALHQTTDSRYMTINDGALQVEHLLFYGPECPFHQQLAAPLRDSGNRRFSFGNPGGCLW